jgi:hypothetical protein
MAQLSETLEIYEYVPMSVPFGGRRYGYMPASGVGINASGGMRGHVVIDEGKPSQITVIVFADTAVRRLATNSWRQATVCIVREDTVLARKVVAKSGEYMISESSRDIYLGSTTFTLPAPVDMTPVHVSVTAISSVHFAEGTVAGRNQYATIPLTVRRVVAP